MNKAAYNPNAPMPNSCVPQALAAILGRDAREVCARALEIAPSMPRNGMKPSEARTLVDALEPQAGATFSFEYRRARLAAILKKHKNARAILASVRNGSTHHAVAVYPQSCTASDNSSEPIPVSRWSRHSVNWYFVFE